MGVILLVFGKLSESSAMPQPSGIVSGWSRSIVKSVPEGVV